MQPVQFGVRLDNDVMKTHTYDPGQGQPVVNFHDAVRALKPAMDEVDPQDKVTVWFHQDNPTALHVKYAMRPSGKNNWVIKDQWIGGSKIDAQETKDKLKREVGQVLETLA